MKKDEPQPSIVIYTTEDGQAKLQVKIEDETGELDVPKAN